MYRWNPFTNNFDEKGDWFFGGNTLGAKKTIGSIDNQDFGIITNNTERLTVLKDGKVGIGTTNPSVKLVVKADANSEPMTLMADAGYSLFRFASRDGTTRAWFGNDTVGRFQVKNFVSNGDLYLTTTGAGNVIIDNGKVGIGTTTPNQQLEITKNFRLSATVGTNAYGVIYKDDNRFIHDFNYGDNGTVITVGYNTFLGVNAGNFTMGSSASATSHSSYNTGIGVNALRDNTTGYQNSAIGVNALLNNTTGSSNSAIGTYALQYNTTGVNNSAIGVQALQNTTGNNNSAIGMQALISNTTGYQNSAIGSNAGRYLSDGTTGRETGNNGLYLGYSSKASANGTNNEIVIGANAIGIGSNTVVLGNDSITKTLLKGEVYFNQSNESVIGINSKGQVYFDTGLADNVGLIIQGRDSQTADLQQFKNVGGDILSSIKANGGMTFFSNDQDDAGERLILQTKLAEDGTDSAKCLLAFKDINGDSKAWLACHHLSSTGTDHSHFSIEISDSSGPLQSRLIFPYDQDICEAVFNQCNLTLRRNTGEYNGNLNIEGLFNHPNYFRFYPYYATNGDYAFGITLESSTHLTLKVFGSDIIYFDDHIQMNSGKEIKGIHKTYDGTVLADGIYTLIDGGTTDGTITIKDGLVVAVQKYVP